MHARWVLVMAVVSAGCGFHSANVEAPPPDAAASLDAGPDVAFDQALPSPDTGGPVVDASLPLDGSPAPDAELTPDASAPVDLGLPPGPTPLGAPCSGPAQCASGFCADGVCCNTVCSGICTACNLAGAVGTCAPIADGADPLNECPAQLPSTCGRVGGCDGRGTCRLQPTGTVCGQPTCVNGAASIAAVCNGSGACTPGATTDCGAYACGVDQCLTTCTVNEQCRGGSLCTGGHCGLAGPKVYWKFDETSGTTAADSSGGGLNGTYVGVVGLPASSPSVPTLSFADPASRLFSATSRQAVALLSVPGTLKPATDLTLSAWFRATTAIDTGADLIDLGTDYFIRLKPTDIEFVKRVATSGTGVYTICHAGTLTTHLDGQWHHVAGVITRQGMTLYLDGTVRGTLARGEDIVYSGSDLYVGRHAAGGANHDFDGYADEIRIYTRALSATEILALAQGGL